MLHIDLGPSSLRLLLQAAFALGRLVNNTIDDQVGDSATGALPIYLPGRWNNGQTCVTCHLHSGIIDPSQAFHGTWSDATYSGLGSPDQVVEVGFTGSAVYVYNIVVDSVVPSTDTLANLTFYIDNELVGAFFDEPTSLPSGSTPQVSYNVLVYGNSSLAYGKHSLQMVTSGIRAANVLFDYVLYTTEIGALSASQPDAVLSTTSVPPSSNPSSTIVQTLSTPSSLQSPSATSHSSSSNAVQTSGAGPKGREHVINTPAIVGGTVGGVGTVVLALVSFFSLRHLYKKRRRTARSRSGSVLSSGLDASDASSYHNPFRTPTDIPDTQSNRMAHLVQQVQALQRQLEELRASQSVAGGTIASASAPSAANREQSLSYMLSALRNEVSALREELGEQHVLVYSPLEVPPSYGA